LKGVKRTYQYRLYPTNEQKHLFTQWLTTCRMLYNTSLAERRDAWITEQRSVTYTEQANNLKAAKTTNPFLRAVHSQVLQDVLRRLDKTLKAFFRRVKHGEKAGYPRFKGRNRYDSFTYPQSGFALNSTIKKLVLSKIGAVTINYHRPLPPDGRIKTCTIKRDVDQWYACFTADLPEKHPLPPSDITTAIGGGCRTDASVSPQYWRHDREPALVQGIGAETGKSATKAFTKKEGFA
jgi:putative transposase